MVLRRQTTALERVLPAASASLDMVTSQEEHITLPLKRNWPSLPPGLATHPGPGLRWMYEQTHEQVVPGLAELVSTSPMPPRASTHTRTLPSSLSLHSLVGQPRPHDPYVCRTTPQLSSCASPNSRRRVFSIPTRRGLSRISRLGGVRSVSGDASPRSPMSIVFDYQDTSVTAMVAASDPDDDVTPVPTPTPDRTEHSCVPQTAEVGDGARPRLSYILSWGKLPKSLSPMISKRSTSGRGGNAPAIKEQPQSQRRGLCLTGVTDTV